METKWSKSKLTIDYHFHWKFNVFLGSFSNASLIWWICVLKRWGAETYAFIGVPAVDTENWKALEETKKRVRAEKQTRKRRRRNDVIISGAELRHFASSIPYHTCAMTIFLQSLKHYGWYLKCNEVRFQNVNKMFWDTNMIFIEK